jgi:hypothetical protein
LSSENNGLPVSHVITDPELIEAAKSGSLDRRRLLKAIALSAAGMAGAGAGLAGVTAATAATATPTEGRQSGVRAAPALAGTPGLTYETFGGWDFHPLASTTAFNWSSIGPGYVISNNGGTMLKSFVPPHGSVLTEVSFFLDRPDTATADDVGFFLGIPSTPTYSSFRAPVPGTGFQRVDVPFSPITVDGATQEFTLVMYAHGSSNRLLMGARVGYKNNSGTTMLPAPIRLLESRPLFEDPSPGQTKPGRPIGTGEKWEVPITGQVMGGVQVPSGAKAVIGNLTVTNPIGAGYLTLFPHGAPQPGTSSINYGPGATVANGVIVGLSSGGLVDFYASAQTDVIFDAAGYIV